MIVLSSDNEGKFRAGSLRPGSYDVSAEPPGFAPFLQSEVALSEGETTRLDFVLRISARSEQVTVRAKAPPGEGALETSSRNFREVLEVREVRESGAKDVAKGQNPRFDQNFPSKR